MELQIISAEDFKLIKSFYPDFKRAHGIESNGYAIDWNGLMPVVEKIESIYDKHHGYFGVHISSNSCMIQGTNLHLAIADLEGYGYVYMTDPNAIYSTKLESTYRAVVEFIKWYNEQKKS